MGIVSIAVRSGICIYAIKYTVDSGVWGDAEKAIKFKEKTFKTINSCEHVQTGKAHFQAYVPLPQVSYFLKIGLRCYYITKNQDENI